MNFCFLGVSRHVHLNAKKLRCAAKKKPESAACVKLFVIEMIAAARFLCMIRKLSFYAPTAVVD